MAWIGDIEVWVAEEAIDRPVSASSHPVESGVNITDHVKPEPAVLKLTGEIVGPGAEEAADLLRSYQLRGMVVDYVGRNVFPGAQIQTFSTRHHHGIVGGFEFEMQLQEVRVAKSISLSGLYEGSMSILATKMDGSQQVIQVSDRQERYHKMMTGETLWYIAGQYKSKGVTVDSLRAANRERDVFLAGHQGDFDYLKPDAELLLGEW